MTDSSANTAARWIPLLVVGMMFNTLGITLRSLGWPRFVLMGVGILLMFVTVVQLATLGVRQKKAQASAREP